MNTTILDPALTMDLTQYNDQSPNKIITNTTTITANGSGVVKESFSEPLKMDTEPDRDKQSGEKEKDAGDGDDDDNDDNVTPATFAKESDDEEGGKEDESNTATKDESMGMTATPLATPAPTPNSTSKKTPSPTSNPTFKKTTARPTAKPTLAYVEMIDDSLDPVSNEEITDKEAFEDGKAKPVSSASSASSTGGADSSKNNDESMEEFEEEVEEEVKKVGGWLSFVFLILMIYTAYQMSENPDGICASLCRLVITVLGCILKIALIPCKYILGGGRPSGGHYMATPDYRDPYGSRHMELT